MGFSLGRLKERLNPMVLLLGFVTVIVMYLVIVPLFFLLWTSLKTTPAGEPGPLTLHNFTQAYLDPTLYPLIGNSFIYATGISIFAFALAFAISWLVERTDTPLRNITYTLILVQLFIPGILSSIAWIMLLSPRIGIFNNAAITLFGLEQAPFNVYSLQAMVFAGGIHSAGTMFLFLSAAMRSMDPALEEAASTSGAGTLPTLWRVTLKLMAPAAVAAIIYTFIHGIEAFEIPAVMGIPAGIQVFSTKIYLANHKFPPDHGLAAALGVTLVTITIVAVLLYQYITRKAERYVTVTGKGYRPRLINLGAWRYPAAAFLACYLLLAVVIPVLVLIWASLLPFYQVPSFNALRLLTFASYVEVLTYPGVQLAAKNSFLLGILGGVITMFLAAIISWIVIRSKVPGRRILDTIAFTPLAIPGIVMGLSLLVVYLTIPNPIYGTIWILLICFVTKYLPWTTRNTNTAFIQIHKELEEASQLSGASWWQTFTRILVPLVIPVFVGGFIWVFIHVIRELSAAIILYSPQSTMLSVIVWEMWNSGTISQVSALAVMLIVFVGLITFIGRQYTERARGTGAPRRGRGMRRH